ncbi:hypothetical protein D9M72_336000 [compost metagenome]
MFFKEIAFGIGCPSFGKEISGRAYGRRPGMGYFMRKRSARRRLVFDKVAALLGGHDHVVASVDPAVGSIGTVLYYRQVAASRTSEFFRQQVVDFEKILVQVVWQRLEIGIAEDFHLVVVLFVAIRFPFLVVIERQGKCRAGRLGRDDFVVACYGFLLRQARSKLIG